MHKELHTFCKGGKPLRILLAGDQGGCKSTTVNVASYVINDEEEVPSLAPAGNFQEAVTNNVTEYVLSPCLVMIDSPGVNTLIKKTQQENPRDYLTLERVCMNLSN